GDVQTEEPDHHKIGYEYTQYVAKQSVEHHVQVTRHAGVEYLAARVRVNESANDALYEDVGVVQRIERNADRGGRPARVLAGLVGAAAPRGIELLAAAGDEPHPDADDVVAALLEDGGRDR